MKILVGCPTSAHKAYCLKEYAAGIKALHGEFDVLVVDNTRGDDYLQEIKSAGLPAAKGPWMDGARDRIVASRNILRRKALDEGYDYFLSLEQDVIPPVDLIARMLAHKKEIVSGIYTKEYTLVSEQGKELRKEERPLVWVLDGKIRQLQMSELAPPRLIQAILTGLGCILIHRSVLENVEFRWSPDRKGFDDAFFCQDAQKAGFRIWADTGILCKHLEMSWEGIQK